MVFIEFIEFMEFVELDTLNILVDKDLTPITQPLILSRPSSTQHPA